MANKVTGKITNLQQTQSVQTPNGSFDKRIVWIAPMYFDRYTGEPTAVEDKFSVQIEFTHERCALLDGYSIGNAITITFDLRGRVYEKDGVQGCITSIDGRAVEAYNGAQPASVSVENAMPQVQAPQAVPQPQAQVAPQPQQGGLPF